MDTQPGHLRKPKKQAPEIAGAPGIAHDEHDQGQAFERAFYASGMGNVLISVDGHFLKVNDVFCDLLGYLPEEVLNRHFLDLTAPEDRAVALNSLKMMCLGELQRIQLVRRYICRDQSLRPLLLTVSVVRDAEGLPLYFAAQLQELNSLLKLVGALGQAEDAANVSPQSHPAPLADVSSSITASLNAMRVSADQLSETALTLEQQTLVQSLQMANNALMALMHDSLFESTEGQSQAVVADCSTDPGSFLQAQPAEGTDVPNEPVHQDSSLQDASGSDADRDFPLRILVAEDNLVNQQLMLNFLEGLGYRPRIVGDGEQALRALEEEPFDLIFMDLQMPCMDGLETSRYINERYGPEKRPIIIALTAFDLYEDRRKCLASGMDDFLTKPISIWQLELLLKYWTQWLREKTRQNCSIPRVDVPALVSRLGHDPVQLQYLIELFDQEAFQLMAGVRQSWEERSLELILSNLHQLKGACLALCVTGLKEKVALLERQLKQQGWTDFAESLSQLETEWESTRAALMQVMGSLKSSPIRTR